MPDCGLIRIAHAQNGGGSAVTLKTPIKPDQLPRLAPPFRIPCPVQNSIYAIIV